jgi:hypothetical protein
METAMADAVLSPSGEDRVCAAVALGWQMAVLYHSPVHRVPVEDPPRAARLPGYSGFRTRLPPPARPRRITGSAAGAMALSGTEPRPAGELPAAPAAT